MAEIEVNIEFYCAICGAGLCNNALARKTQYNKWPTFDIEPCEKCLSNAEDSGYDKGYQQGKEDFDNE